MFRATKDYHGSDYPECIALSENDIVSDVTKLDSVWYRGTNARTGETGTFPLSCVEAVGDAGKQLDIADISMDKGNMKTGASINDNARRDRSDTLGSIVRFNVDIDVDASPNNNKQSDSKIRTDNHANVSATDSDPSLKKKLFMSSTEKLLKSDRGEHRGLKAVAGAVTGVVAGVIMFILLKFSFDYATVEALVITLVFTIIVSVCLAASTFCRCIMALVIPNFFTGKGRAVILTIIFAVMLSKPITNIANNAKETGNSMACAAEMVVNQSRALQEQLAVPIQQLSNYVQTQKEQMDSYTAGLRTTLDVLDKQLGDFKRGVEKAEEAIEDVIKKCEETLKEIKDACKSACGVIGIIGVNCGKCDAIGDGCGQLKKVLKDKGVMSLAQSSKVWITKVTDFFKADVEIYSRFDANAKANKSLDSIQEEVNRDITSKVRTFTDIVGVTKKIISLSLALIFFQSFWYLKNYLAKDAYDNVYITKEFVKLDKTSPNPVLPLKEKEKSVYILTSSLTLNTNELSYCKVGLLQVLLHFILCFVVVVFDYALYYILSEVSKYSNVSLSAGGDSKIVVGVNGTGPVSDFYRLLLEGVHIDENFNKTINIEACLPKPHVPFASTIPVFLVLYLFALAFVVLRGYGMRLRRKIAAYFYPEQERERLEYLHKKIRHKRVGFLKFLRQQIKSSNKESRVKDKLRFSTWLMFNFPCLARCMPEKSQQECTSCEQKDSSFHHIKITSCKGVTGGMSCDAVYCEECWTALHNVCPLCSKDEVDMRE